MGKGKIVKLVKSRGFGFIDPDEETIDREVEGDLFFHHSALTDSYIEDLESGDEVEFEIESTEKGPAAKNIRRIIKADAFDDEEKEESTSDELEAELDEDIEQDIGEEEFDEEIDKEFDQEFDQEFDDEIGQELDEDLPDELDELDQDIEKEYEEPYEDSQF